MSDIHGKFRDGTAFILREVDTFIITHDDIDRENEEKAAEIARSLDPKSEAREARRRRIVQEINDSGALFKTYDLGGKERLK